jgi:chloride channel protein, CIC family
VESDGPRGSRNGGAPTRATGGHETGVRARGASRSGADEPPTDPELERTLSSTSTPSPPADLTPEPPSEPARLLDTTIPPGASAPFLPAQSDSAIDVVVARRILRFGRSLLPRAIADRASRLLGHVPWLDPAGPLELGLLGRMLLHAALVGLAAGVVGAAFFYSLELAQRVFLEDITGYIPLRAHGEPPGSAEPGTFRPWLLVFLPALGGLACGLIQRLAPETRGGGGDAMIEAFHHQDALIRRRVSWVKFVASIFTLGTGGAGGREGPTMQIGGAIGSLIGRLLNVSARERRILLLAGVAAGMSAVFRTPLGAALLAVEVLYRDGFESDALIPAVLASVVSYSVVISIYGESTLFAHAMSYPFVPTHLPLYGLLAVCVAALASAFVASLRLIQRRVQKLQVPLWCTPAIGGLALGIFCTPLIMFFGYRVGAEGQGLGLLSGGYGAVQMAITGSPWLSEGWGAVELLLLLCAGKLIAASLTIGSGGSAGDFAPSLVLGGLFGGAFGRAAALLLHDPRIDAGAFALVGMGAFYGGIAHVPLASLVMVCELAGSYDLLVPLMLAEGIAFVALRKRALYHSQLPTQRDSPVHRRDMMIEVLSTIHVRDVMKFDAAFVRFEPSTPAADMLRTLADAPEHQDIFPVIDKAGVLKGIITADALRILATEGGVQGWAVAADVMQRPSSVKADDNLSKASRALLRAEVRALPVVGEGGAIVGFLDEADVIKAYLARPGSEAERRSHGAA